MTKANLSFGSPKSFDTPRLDRFFENVEGRGKIIPNKSDKRCMSVIKHNGHIYKELPGKLKHTVFNDFFVNRIYPYCLIGEMAVTEHYIDLLSFTIRLNTIDFFIDHIKDTKILLKFIEERMLKETKQYKDTPKYKRLVESLFYNFDSEIFRFSQTDIIEIQDKFDLPKEFQKLYNANKTLYDAFFKVLIYTKIMTFNRLKFIKLSKNLKV